MKRNLRLAAAAVAATALALIGANLWVEIKTEERLQAMVAARNAAADGPLRVHLTAYQRGLFTSTAITEIELLLPAGLSGRDQERRWLRLPVRHEIKHGPLIIGKLPGRGWRREPLLAVIHSALDPRALGAGGEQWRLTADTIVTLQGDVLISFALAPVAPPTTPQLGLAGQIKIERQPAKLSGELRVHDLAWRRGEDDYRVRDLHLALAARTEGNGLLAGELNGRLAALEAGARRYGPGELVAHWRNLPGSAGSRLLSLAPQAGKNISGRTAQTLVETLPEIIRSGTAVTVEKLRLNAPEGELSGSLRLGFKGGKEDRLFHPLMLLSALRFDLTLAGPEKLALLLAPERRQLLEALMARGYPIREQEQLRLHLSYQEGNLLLNDTPLPLQELLPLGRL